ncbi:hypothetical protein [Streptomyces capitiformicae]|uniref:Uncharacterized protein n=1 Tax=Streptomyces capitiformicae TaxID=2014920 RepID=A0A918Z1K5_9ACTN|nr:hypothetical protein [Streptomyces capitiformicae]GHE34014.1 hypothetical protein GCM10017771_51370 [Streptomyces capitiformicae]
MLRVITSGTHRRFQEAVTEAERIPGLETELADLRAKLKNAQSGKDDAARTAEDLEDARQAGAEIAATLTQPDARQRDAILDIAASLVRHAQGLGLDVKRLHSGEPYSTSPTASVEPESPPAAAESGESARLPYVHVYVHQGQIRSVHRWSEAAVRQAHADGAPPEGWCQDRSCSEMPGPMPYSLYPLPVQEPWPDRSQVHLLLRGRPIAAFGTEQAARRDSVITRMAATESALITVVSWPIADSHLYPTGTEDEHGLDTDDAQRHHARLLAAMATGRCAAMRREKVEPPEDFLQLCSNLRAAAVKLSVTEAEIDEYASTWAALL